MHILILYSADSSRKANIDRYKPVDKDVDLALIERPKSYIIETSQGNMLTHTTDK